MTTKSQTASNNELPITPQISNAMLPVSNMDKISTNRKETEDMTPPPSTQVDSRSRTQNRTPTPTYSSISTPPPTIEVESQSNAQKKPTFSSAMTSEELETASAEELKTALIALQSAYQESKMSAAHYKLQYQMLAQESAAAIERMAVEASMAQHENDVLHIAEQAKATATPLQTQNQEGMIPVQKDLYQSMCAEIQQLTRVSAHLRNETRSQEQRLLQQESEIESLFERNALLKERLRQNREQINQLRQSHPANEQKLYGATPRNGAGQDQFAALLQASEMARQETVPKSSHRKTSQGRTNVTMTPQRYHKQTYATPPQRQQQFDAPATAPLPRPTGFRAANISAQRSSNIPIQPVKKLNLPPPPRMPPPPQSEDTVSNSDIDSEAETDIIEPDEEVSESQASRAASMMLRTSDEHDSQPRSQPTNLKQSRLFGAIRKQGIDREESDRPSKKAKTTNAIGLGIVGART